MAIFSYDGAPSFGVSGDYDTTRDIDVVCQGLGELVALAQPPAPGAPEPVEDRRARGQP